MRGTAVITVILLCKIVQCIYTKRMSIDIHGRTQLMTSTAYQYLLCMLLAAMLLPAGHGGLLSPEAAGISFVGGIALFGSTLCSLMAMKNGTMLLATLFGSAGLVIPCVAGIFLFGEPLSIWQCLGMAGLIYAAYLLVGCSRQIYNGFSAKSLLYLLGAFLSNGIVMLTQKFYALSVPEGEVSVFSFLAFGTAFLLLGIAGFADIRRTGSRLKEIMPKQLLIYGALLSAVLFLINYLATEASAIVPSVILFSLVNGGSTVISALVAAILYREPVSRKSALGIVVSIAALIVINTF